MFEKYEFAGAYIAIQAVLTLYAQGMVLLCILISLSANFKNIKYISILEILCFFSWIK